MKKRFLSIAISLTAPVAFVVIAAVSFSFTGSRGVEPWKPEQLLAPADLAKTLQDPRAKQPIVFCIGPGAIIRGSIDIGPAKDSNKLAAFRKQLDKLPRDADIVIYCGCCPFVHCPNVRPAFALLTEMNFTHPRLLNLEHNIKTDWIDKNYPSVK